MSPLLLSIKQVGKRKNVNVKQKKLKAAYTDFQAAIDIIRRRQFMASYTGGKLAKHIIAPDEHNFRAKQKHLEKMAKQEQQRPGSLK